MKPFQIVLFVFAILVAGTQTMRHVYVKWVAPEGSVLDQFNSEVQSDIAAADTLDELVPLYAEATERVREFEADPANQDANTVRRTTPEPYLSQGQLRQAIMQRERMNRQLGQLVFYWIAGLVAIGTGMLVYARVNPWLGMASVITGFSEHLWWTSPLTGITQGSEFALLLDVKLALSFVTLAGLIGLWLLRERGFVLAAGSESGDA